MKKDNIIELVKPKPNEQTADDMLRNAMGHCDNGLVLLSYNEDGMLCSSSNLTNAELFYMIEQLKFAMFNKRD